jgi:two-component sensor histidine kinase
MARERRDRTGAAGLERRYQALFENMSEGFVLCEAIRDQKGELTDYWIRAANPVFDRRAPQSMVGRRLRELRPETSPLWFAACGRALKGLPVRFEYFDTVAQRWYDVHMTRVSDTEFGQFYIDVTDAKAAQRRQAELFDELNHRVKNNLAVVSSILELQARAAPLGVREHLVKAVDRIRSIGDLHTALYQQGSPEAVDLCPYLEALCQRLEASLFADGQARIASSCAHIRCEVQEAVSLGLIVNELVTNAAKHAFAGGRPGTVSVTLSAGPGERRLVVADDGQGLAETHGPESLGLRIVRSLTRSLGGEVHVRAKGGLSIEVVLPEHGAQSGEASAERQGRLL